MTKTEKDRRAARKQQKTYTANMRAIKKSGLPPHVRNERSVVTWEIFK